MRHKTDHLGAFSRLPKEIEAELRESVQVITYFQGEAVFLQEDAPEAVYLVADGRIKIVRVTPEGHESILCVRGPGDYFCPVPLLDGGPQLGTAIAMSNVALLAIEREKFCDLCERSAELKAMVQGDCLAKVRHLLNRLEAFAFRNVQERVAITLLDEVQQQQSYTRQPGEVRLTQQELAALVGASRERVSRVLKEMEQAGVIAQRRGRMRILDIEELKRITEKREFHLTGLT